MPRYVCRTLLLLLLFVPPSACRGGDEYAVGADVSFLADAEASGIKFQDQGGARPGLEILKDHGFNWIRLRLFHTPDTLPNDLQYTLAAARQAQELGFKLLLDFHYSDTWADPGKQFLPKAWVNLDHQGLVAALEAYTHDTLTAFQAAGIKIDMVQIGNEIINGVLWPDGRLPDHWKEFSELVKAGIDGVDAASTDQERPQIMLHIDRGGDKLRTQAFFDNCQQFGIEFDVIGQSFYPWWHGNLQDLRENLALMANRYGKPIILVEVAYNWQPTEYRDAPGLFPESPEGQAAFLEQVDQAVRATPGGLGRGVFWWEPAVKPGPISSRAMFDRQGKALPVISVFGNRQAGKGSTSNR
jgi:arabinogalactan endo-1,4-beta-galactosidase